MSSNACRLADLRHVPAATVGLDRVIDDLGPNPLQEVVHLHRVFGAVAVLDGADDLAAVIRGDPQPGQRPHDLVPHRPLADVVVDHVEHVADHHPARIVVQAAGGQALVDLRAHFRKVGHQPVGLLQVQVAGRARGDELLDLRIDQGQVAGDDGTGRQLVLAEVFRRPAAVPIVDLLEFDVQQVGHFTDRMVIGGGVDFQRTSGVVGVSHG